MEYSDNEFDSNVASVENITAEQALSLFKEELSVCFDDKRRAEIIKIGLSIARNIDYLNRCLEVEPDNVE